WICGRAAFLGAEWMYGPPPSPGALPSKPANQTAQVEPFAEALSEESPSNVAPASIAEGFGRTIAFPARRCGRQLSAVMALAAFKRSIDPEEPPAASETGAAPPPSPLLASSPKRGRWSGSAWLFVREGNAPQLAAAGTLGGSQVGGRILYRLNDDAD